MLGDADRVLVVQHLVVPVPVHVRGWGRGRGDGTGEAELAALLYVEVGALLNDGVGVCK